MAGDMIEHCARPKALRARIREGVRWTNMSIAGLSLRKSALDAAIGAFAGATADADLRLPIQRFSAIVFALKDGFMFSGKHFRSLSKIACEITGIRWSGLAGGAR
jgi:hypothetical protein